MLSTIALTGFLSVWSSLFVGLEATSAQESSATFNETKATTVTFGAIIYQHRWSKDGQHEYTPDGQEDLERWRDMLTINVHEGVTDGEQLADLANRVLERYSGAGKILRTNSIPRTAEREAEHFAVAVLGTPKFVEAVFARFVLVDGVGFVIVYSHRLYGLDVAGEMGSWVQENGSATEDLLMMWRGVPPLTEMRQLPQSR